MSPAPENHRRQVILDATVELIVEGGWAGLAMRAIAERAGVSLTTIYHFWPTKTDLALAAVQSVTLAQDWSLESIRDLFADRPNLVLCLVSIQRADPSRRAAIDEQFAQVLVGPLRDAAIEASGGELDDDTASMIALLGPAFLFVRSIVLERPVNATELERLADLIDRTARTFGPGGQGVG